MAISIFTDIKYRTQQSAKLTAADVDKNFATSQAQTLASSNSILYLGPTPSGFTISNSTSLTARPQRFIARLPSDSLNTIGNSQFYLKNSGTFSFVFSGTASSVGGGSGNAVLWWYNISQNYGNGILTLSDTSATQNVFEFTIGSMSFNQNECLWNLTTNKVSGPTYTVYGGSADLFSSRAYTVGWRTTQPANSSYTFGWSASIPMSGQNFPLTIGTMSPNIIYTNDYILKITGASVQFVTGTQTTPAFAINLLANSQLMATATFSNIVKQNQVFRLIPRGLIVEGDSVISLTGTTYSNWGGITFSSATASRINVFLTYERFPSPDTGFIDEIE